MISVCPVLVIVHSLINELSCVTLSLPLRRPAPSSLHDQLRGRLVAGFLGSTVCGDHLEELAVSSSGAGDRDPGRVILENHLHWIAVGPQLSKRVGEFKSFTATSILKHVKVAGRKTLLQELAYFKLRHKVDQEHQLWQEGSHPQIIETEEMMWQKIEYIHNNPLRRGCVDDPVHWRYSSARSYAGMVGLLDVCVDWR